MELVIRSAAATSRPSATSDEGDPVGTIPIDAALLAGPQGELHGHQRARRPAHRLRPAHARGLDRRQRPARRRGRLRRPHPPGPARRSSSTSRRQPEAADGAEEPPPRRSTRTSSARSTSSSSRCARPTACRTPTSSTSASWCRRPKPEMLKTKNFGRKSLNEIKEILAEMGSRLRHEARELPAARGARPTRLAAGEGERLSHATPERRDGSSTDRRRTASALFRNLVTALLQHDAHPDHRRQGEGAAPLGGPHDHARQARQRSQPAAARFARVRDRDAVTKLFDEIAPRFARAGRAATRASSSSGFAPGDAAPISLIELTGRGEEGKKKGKGKARKAPKAPAKQEAAPRRRAAAG